MAVVPHSFRSQPQSMLVQRISKIMPLIFAHESQFDRLSRVTSPLDSQALGYAGLYGVPNPDIRGSAGGSAGEADPSSVDLHFFIGSQDACDWHLISEQAAALLDHTTTTYLVDPLLTSTSASI